MLLQIPKLITPDLLKSLCEMGHGSELIIADANFPACDCVSSDHILYLPSVGNAELLNSILQLFPLDSYGENMIFMQPDPGWDIPSLWEKYEKTACKYQKNVYQIQKISRMDFYKRAKKSHVVIVTGEQAPYANILLVKGVIQTSERSTENAEL